MLSDSDKKLPSISTHVKNTVTWRDGKSNPGRKALRDYVSDDDELQFVDDGKGNAWLFLKMTRDREAIHALLTEAAAKSTEEGRGWLRDPDDHYDEVRWVSQEFLDQLGPKILDDVQTVGKKFSSEVMDFLINRWADRYDEAGPLFRKLLLTHWRIKRAKSPYARINKECNATGKGLVKVLSAELESGRVLLKCEGYVYAGKNLYRKASFRMEAPDNLRFYQKYSQYTRVFDHIQALNEHGGEYPIGRLDGNYVRSLSDPDNEGERARATREERASMMGLLLKSSMPVAKEHQVQNAVLDPELLKKDDSDLYDKLFPFSQSSINNAEGAIEGIDRATVLDFGVWFGLEKKSWMGGLITNATPIKYDPTIIDGVVMSDIRKRALKALSTTPPQNLDVIAQKGENTAFLLTGEPGTGKTLVAEAIAHYLKRPLLKIGFGELGTNVNQVESRMRRYMRYANRWKAVSLLDEADVFLAKRDNTNLERTAMVASFLSLLEYFQGTLFLTTNRTEEIDPAIASRMSLTLKFDRASLDDRIIWRNLLAKVGISDTPEPLIEKLSALDLNGREIKNLISTASRVAKFEGVKLTPELVLKSRDLCL